MDLFNSSAVANILPFDGTVEYYGSVFNAEKATNYFDLLLKNIEWKNDEVMIFGKQITTKRKVAWYADDEIEYVYSNVKKQGLAWTNELLAIKKQTEELTGESYNACLLNLYHDGEEGMGWHSDNEKSIVKDSAIASISFGAERKFSLKHKSSGETVSQILESGSLLMMKGETQTFWLHALTKSKKVRSPRINLTFRKMVI
ncbi:alpha-ketoglutarate-dependent dioxygenase AlkB family protein [Pedobacter cryophilus]|uniref:Alpha-ketoglutarate-dependent dioxygenase AlkB n=1 Tax=Pedobacter cryophilus TaxID=2571271 RepID=A0A4U1C4D2_9SPHI|nr:alpha-ketoglutarate-dependent dioxygenase AlkB [Pedobacter cryophilus]TKC00700.1 alpha-ketoglutarate-dependent dioxygenase AlkB [Pedobacter cryophilus]